MGHDVHHVRLNVVEQTLIMRDQQRGPVRRLQGIHALGHDAQGINVQARVGFVQNGQARIQDCHLQDLITLLFTAAVINIHVTFQKALVNLQQTHLVLYKLNKIEWVHGRFIPVLAVLMIAGPQKQRIGHARQFHRILKRQKHTLQGSLMRLQFEQVKRGLARRIRHVSLCHFVVRMAGQHLGQGALSGTIGPHDGVHLACRDLKIHTLQDLCPVHHLCM